MNEKFPKQQKKSKPYPRRCAECGKEVVIRTTVSHDAKIRHDGKVYEFHIHELPVDQCSSCDEVFFTNVSSDAKTRSLRDHLGLLQADQIRELLAEHRLTQRKFANHLRVAEESVSRWLNNLSVQSRALDTLMRLYFSIREVRESLASGEPIETFGASQIDTKIVVSYAVGIANIGYEAGTAHPIFSQTFSKSTLQRRKKFQLVA